MRATRPLLALRESEAGLPGCALWSDDFEFLVQGFHFCLDRFLLGHCGGFELCLQGLQLLLLDPDLCLKLGRAGFFRRSTWEEFVHAGSFFVKRCLLRVGVSPIDLRVSMVKWVGAEMGHDCFERIAVVP